MIDPSVADTAPPVDASRRTWLAAERTWLAWWRTALGGVAVSVAVGRFLPEVAHRSRLVYGLLGIGYGLLAIAVLIMGVRRQQRIAHALRTGGEVGLPESAVMWLTASALLLAAGTLAIVVAGI